MKAINYILGFGGFTFSVAAVVFSARFAAFAWRCHDLPLAASCVFGVVWFAALGAKFVLWAWGDCGGVGHAANDVPAAPRGGDQG